jgi:uncharacterized membrane protein
VVETEFDRQRCCGRIVLRPNRSWSWQANLYLLGSLALASSVIPILLAMRGYWLVLPFSVVELGAVAAALYVCVRRTHRQEVIHLSPTDVVLEAGHRRCEQRHRFDRFSTRILVEPPRRPWDRSRVAVRCRQHEHEVGSFLTQDERHELVRDMREMIYLLNDHGAALPPAFGSGSTGARQ